MTSVCHCQWNSLRERDELDDRCELNDRLRSPAGKLYRRTGQRDQAGEHLTIATAMYREMDMAFWLEQAEPETRELS